MEVSTWKMHELSSMLPHVDWNQFEPSTSFSFHEAQPALIASYAVLFVLGSVGNFWVAFVVGYLLIRSRSSRRSGDAPLTVQIYIFALCLCDLLVLAFLPLLLLDLSYGSWKIPSSSLCKIYLLSEGFNKFGAPWILTALSGFCYSNIRLMGRLESRTSNGESSHCSSSASASYANHEQKYRESRRRSLSSKRRSSVGVVAPSPIFRQDNGRRAAATVAACIAVVVAAMCPVYIYADIYYVVVHNESEVHVLALKCAFQPPETILTAFTVYSFLLGYLCPAFLFTYYYSAILFYVRRHRRGLVHTLTLGGRSRRRYCRVTRTAIGLVGWTLAAWTPYWTIFLYFYFHPQTDTEASTSNSTAIVLSYFVHMLPYINCSGYPILYTLLNKNIRAAYARAKMASANRRRRRLLSMANTNETNSTSGGSSSRRPLRSSLDYLTNDLVTQIAETISLDDPSLILQWEDCDKSERRKSISLGKTDSSKKERKRTSLAT